MPDHESMDCPPRPCVARREDAEIDDPPLKVRRTSEHACLPVRASEGAAGYDLCASEDGSIAPGTRKVVKTGLEFAIPPGCYGRIAPRSGLSIRNGIDIAAGVLDPDYRVLPALLNRPLFWDATTHCRS